MVHKIDFTSKNKTIEEKTQIKGIKIKGVKSYDNSDNNRNDKSLES